MSLRFALPLVLLVGCSGGGGGGTGGGGAAGGAGGGSSGAGGGTSGTGGGTSGTGGGSSSSGCPSYEASNPNHHAYGGSTPTPLITADETWRTDHVYFIFSVFEVKGCTLTIEPGARICLSPGSGVSPTITVSGAGATEGKVFINGTTAQPVVFDRATSSDTYSGFFFVGPSDARFDHVIFKNAAIGSLGVVRFGANHPHAGVLRDVHFEDFGRTALSVQNPTGLSSDSSVYFDSIQAGSTDAIIQTSIAAAKTLTPATIHVAAAIPALNRGIRFIDRTVSADLTLSGTIGADYVVATGDLLVRRSSSTDPIPTLTLEAGARMRFGDGELSVSWLGQGNEGNVVANGTSANPVVLTSMADTPARGDWNGVTFYAGGPGTMALHYVRIENAGGGGGANIVNCRATSNLAGALKLRPIITAPYAGPTLDHLEIVRSGGDGVAFGCVMAGCLTTDYAAQVTGSDNAGTLLRALGCP